MNRSATERLATLVKTELERQNVTGEEIAREARLPSKVFRSLLQQGHRPALDRADEVCKALGISMRIGVNPTDGDNGSEQ